MKQRPSIASLRTWCNRIENLSVACCNRRPILHIPISNRTASMNVIWLSFFPKPTEIFNHIFHASRHNMTLIQVSDKERFFQFSFQWCIFRLRCRYSVQFKRSFQVSLSALWLFYQPWWLFLWEAYQWFLPP